LIQSIFNKLVLDSIFFEKINVLHRHEKLFKKNVMFKHVFKSSFKLDKSLLVKSRFSPKFFKKNNSESMYNLDLFKSFIYLNTWLPTPKIETHASFNVFFMYNSNLNVGFFNVKKVFQAWNNIIIFISNMFFYGIKYSVFGSSYFKYEVLSLNWNQLSFIRTLWRYTHPFIFYLRNNTTMKNRLYFDYLTKAHHRIAIIVDIYYHSRTIYYCNRYKLISIGPVPISSNFYTLSIVLPTSSNLAFSNLFFLRLFLKLQKLNANLVFNNYRNITM
jgi:hypothetical protein